MPRYPAAEFVPWQYVSPTGQPTYYKGLNRPSAVVLHIMQGYLRTARQWAEEGHYGASWHFSVGRDGTVLQNLDFPDGGYHAGITVSQGESHPPTWELWRGKNTNVNHYTIGIEHEGFYDEPWPEAQRIASKALCQWLAQELGIPYERAFFPAHAEIDVINRVNDFATPADREVFYAYLFEEDDMTEAETRAMIDAAVAPIKLQLDSLNKALMDRFNLFEIGAGPIEGVRDANQKLEG